VRVWEAMGWLLERGDMEPPSSLSPSPPFVHSMIQLERKDTKVYWIFRHIGRMRVCMENKQSYLVGFPPSPSTRPAAIIALPRSMILIELVHSQFAKQLFKQQNRERCLFSVFYLPSFLESTYAAFLPLDYAEKHRTVAVH